MGSLGWGIIGCGDVVERKSGPSIQQAGRSRIVAAMRRDRAKAGEFAVRFGVPFFTDRAEDVIAHPDVGIVYVATPPSSHMDYVAAAAQAGKHVLVEKPMALSARQAEAMIEACERAGVQLFVAYYRRFQPHVQAMKRLMEAGRVGRPLLGCIELAARPMNPESAGWRAQPEISGGGQFVVVGYHRVDAMNVLMGQLIEAVGMRSTLDASCKVEQLVSLSLKFAGGAQATIAADYVSGRRVDGFAIVGTEGAIVAENFDSHRFVLEERAGREEFEYAQFPAPHLGLIRHIESVLLDGAPNESSGRDGLMTERVLDVVRASAVPA